MKRESMKIIKKIFLTSLVVIHSSCGIILSHNIKENEPIFKNAEINLGLSENEMIKEENTKKLIQAEDDVNKAKEEVETVSKNIELAKEEKDTIANEVKMAEDNIKNVEVEKEKALKEVINAKTEEEREEALEKVKSREEEMKKASEEKEKVETKIEEVVKQSTNEKTNKNVSGKNTQDASKGSLSEEQLKYMLEQAKKGEEADKKALEEKLQAQAKAAAEKKAEREAKEQEEKEKVLKEAKERAERESTAGLEERLKKEEETCKRIEQYERQQEELSKVKKYVGVKAQSTGTENAIVAPRYNDLTDEDYGQIWFAKFTCDMNRCEGFIAPGSNTLTGSVYIGRRGDISSITMYAPKAKSGYKFVKWVESVDPTYAFIKSYEAIYEKI